MKSGNANCIVASAIVVALAAPTLLMAQNDADNDPRPTRYSVTSLGTLGGTVSTAYGINNRGWVTGAANLTGDQNEHPFLWRDGIMSDLGTAGGPNGSAGFPIKNNRGLVVGFAQTSTPDPLGENWTLYCNLGDTLPCAGTDLVLPGFAWQDGVKRLMPTLGGNNGYATGANNRGQVVGFAETANQDPTCVPPQVLDYEAVMWTPVEGSIQMLPPFPGDTSGAAIGINDRSQVVGTSGQCAPVSPAIAVHALLWQNGNVTNLGSLGGLTGNLAYAINNRTQVVGISDLAGDTTAHAFLWQNGKMIDLGTLPGDVFSVAFSINNGGLVVGQSCDQNGNCRAFLWQNGVMTDLNAVISRGCSLNLISANDINDRGDIVGQGYDPNTGEAPAFLARRTGDDGASDGAASAAPIQSPKIILPDNIREMLQQGRGFVRFRSLPSALNGPSSSPADQQSLSCAETKDATGDAGIFYPGHCRVVYGQLDGYCANACGYGLSPLCPKGAPVEQGGQTKCWHFQINIDLARPCNWGIPR